jgi:hypothetical protein
VMNSERYPHIDPDYQARDEGQALGAERRQRKLDNLWEAYGSNGRRNIRLWSPSRLRASGPGGRWILRRAHECVMA